MQVERDSALAAHPLPSVIAMTNEVMKNRADHFNSSKASGTYGSEH
jgi:hypothetical protein